MRRNRRGGLMAMENENFEGGAGGGEELGAAPESLETDLIDVNEEAEDAAADEAQTDDATEVAEALESLALSLESAIKEKGGLDAAGAEIAGQYSDFLYARVGMDRKSIVALESFGGTATRQRSTKIAMEDIAEAAKAIWDKIVKAIKDAIAWVKERFVKVFGAAEKLQKRAKALEEKAGATSGNAEEKNFESERLVKALHKSGAVSNVGADAQTLGKLAGNIFGTVTQWNGKIGEDILEVLEAPDKVGEFTFEAFNPTQLGGMQKAGADFGDAGNGMTFVVGEELPGGQAIVARIPASASVKGAEAVEALGRTSVSVSAKNPKAKAPSKTQVATLQPSECEKIAAAVGTLAEEIASYKRVIDKLTATKEKIVAAAGKAQKAADNSSDEDDAGKADRSNNKLLAKLGMAVPKLIDQPATGFAAYGLNTGKAMLDYVELSLKQYGSSK